jgi:hypothetical protein
VYTCSYAEPEKEDLIRRFLFLVVVAAVAITLVSPDAFAAERLIQVDRCSQVSGADLNYDKPATRDEEGMPVGNGRTGSLVWTSPSALKLQINRVDVHAMDSTTTSFQRADSDYGSVCGYVDINVAGGGEDVFVPGSFRQHLSLYGALMTVQGKGLTARALAWPHGDVLAMESQLGGQSRLASPWDGGDVSLYRNGKKAEDLSGKTLAFSAAKGETVVVVPRGATPASVKMN